MKRGSKQRLRQSKPRGESATSHAPRENEGSVIWIWIIIVIQIILVLFGIGNTPHGNLQSVDQPVGLNFPQSLTLLHTEKHVRSYTRFRKHIEAFEAFMTSPARKIPQGRRQEVGLLIVAGGGGTCSDAIVTARVTRDGLKSRIPIAIAYYGPHGCSAASWRYLDSTSMLLDVHLMDLHKMKHPRHHRPLDMIYPESIYGSDQWMEVFPKGLIRAMALYHAPFAHHVLLVDAGVIPVQDPVALLNSTSYSQTSIGFWMDLTPQDNPGIEGQPPCGHDARHMMIHAAANWDWIEWNMFLHSYPEYSEQGASDDAIFQLAFSKTTSSPTCSTMLPSILLGNLSSASSQRTKPTWGPVAVIQPHPEDGTPLFLHSLTESLLHTLAANSIGGIWQTTGPINTLSIITEALDLIEKRKKKAVVTSAVDDTIDIDRELQTIESHVWWDRVFDGTERKVYSIALEGLEHAQRAVIDARNALPFVIQV